MSMQGPGQQGHVTSRQPNNTPWFVAGGSVVLVLVAWMYFSHQPTPNAIANAPAAPAPTILTFPPGTKIIIPGGTDDGGDDTQPAGDKPKGGNKDKGGGGNGNVPRNNPQPCTPPQCPQWVQCTQCGSGTVNASYQGQQPQLQPPPAQPTVLPLDEQGLVDFTKIAPGTIVTAGMIAPHVKALRKAANANHDAIVEVKTDLDTNVKPKVNALHAQACAKAYQEGEASWKALLCPPPS